MSADATMLDRGRETELRTARLLLRAFRARDVDDSQRYRDDPELARYLPHIPQPFTRADAKDFVARNMNEPWEILPTFAIVFDERVVGTVNLAIDVQLRSAMLGYTLARVHWGRGLATEAATAVVQWAFAARDLVEIWASTDPENVRSRRVLEKLGMTLEPREGAREVRYALRR